MKLRLKARLPWAALTIGFAVGAALFVNVDGSTGFGAVTARGAAKKAADTKS